MLRRQTQVRGQIHTVVDAVLFALSFWLAYWLRYNATFWLEGVWEISPIWSFSEYAWLLVVIAPVGPFLLGWQGFYDRTLPRVRREIARKLLSACLIMVVSVVLVMFLVRNPLARSVIILHGVLSFVVIFCKEELIRFWCKSKWGQSQIERRIILAGTKIDNDRWKRDIGRRLPPGFAIVGEVNLEDESPERVVELMHRYSANGVVINSVHVTFDRIEQTIHVCELEGVEVWLVADFFKTRISRTVADEFCGMPILVFRSTPDESWSALGKRVLDFVGALTAVVVLSPFLLTVAVIIKLTSPGPVFFKQKRSGLNGRPFTMLKFRSMVTNADQLKQELAVLNEMSGPVFKLSNDPRVTKIGRFMRKFSVDEMPQLLNVLRGEMSLVGPRPLPVDEVKRFDDRAHRRRLSMKPGLTCLWQVSGRNNVTDFKEWVRLDLEYIDNWSLWLDIKIILRTIPIVLTGAGAR
ncbi:MAG: sugar transferase [Verrucomicrobia bacterium]|nr:sugar transferase [Verrucomicrobiota bacterium]MCF7708708.1 sugar transferase [Verrucomicrobiota bacterium]